jgi:ABC-type anion transport system duplicated permease subunit
MRRSARWGVSEHARRAEEAKEAIVREVPRFVCFDMASPARVVWVIVRSSLVFFAAVAWLALHPFPLERAARSSIVRSAAQPAAAQLDHIMPGLI